MKTDIHFIYIGIRSLRSLKSTIYYVMQVSLLFFCLFSSGCKTKTETTDAKYSYISPDYNLVRLHVLPDTLTYQLNEQTYNAVKSFNIFSHNDIDFISFYDDRSASINIYNFHSRVLAKKISIKDCFHGRKLYKTTVYTKNFDSIFITNKATLFLMDSSGNFKKSIDFLENPPYAWAHFGNTAPVVFKDDLVLAGVRPYVKDKSLKALKDWKVLYGFNLQNDKAILYYHLPSIYQNNLFGYQFLDYSYCYNSKGNFVFSFPADSNVYETNLRDYHIAYFARSRFQDQPIQPVPKEDLSNSENAFRSYLLRDSYGPIYFDPYAKRYLRVAKKRISKADYDSKNRRKKQRLLIFNDFFKIIGESEIDNSILLGSLFFTTDGKIYARINAEDEYALHFVRITYSDDKLVEPAKLAKNETN
jgi:hypothetical protein